MWRLITILGTLLACANASGQGKVSFGNDSAHLFYYFFSEPLPISPLPNGFTVKAALYAGRMSDNLGLQTSVVLDSAGMTMPGRMASKSIILTSVPGGAAAYFMICIVNNETILPASISGSASPSGFPGAIYVGTSGLFTAIPGSSINYPALVSGGSSQSTWTGPIHVGCLECIPPWFLTNPSNSVVKLGNDVTLNATADDYVAEPFSSISYQWRKQFAPIAGATNDHLTLTNVTLSDTGNYDVIASNEYGSTPSAIATVTVVVPAVLGSPSYNANNQFQFTVTGAPGTNYIVQISTNLSIADWVSVFTNPAPFTFVDSNVTSSPQRFYRAQVR